MGLDSLHGQMRALYALAQDAVPRYGGVIHSVAGTRLLAIFEAAWSLHQHLGAPSGDPPEARLAVRLAVHTGVVVLGGIGDARESAAVGDLIAALEALEERGAPGMLICSEATARLVRHDVRLEEAAPVVVPRQPTPVRTYRVTGLRSRGASGEPPGPRALSPFVGRAHELTALHAILARLMDGRGQAVGIVGEPGIEARLLAGCLEEAPPRHGSAGAGPSARGTRP